MKKCILLFCLLLSPFFLNFMNAQVATIVFTGTGGDDNWENTANWNLNRLPTADDDVAIASVQIVIINANTTIRSLHVPIDALLEVKAFLTVKGGHPQTGIGVDNRGVISVFANSRLILKDIAVTGLLNQNSLIIQENARLNFTTDDGLSYYFNAGIENSGEIVNSGDIFLSQDHENFTPDDVKPAKAMINSGIIRNLDFFSLDDIVENRTGGEIINSGNFSVEVAIGVFNSDEMLNQGTITNQNGGRIDINQLKNEGQVTNETGGNWDSDFILDRGQFTNAGTVALKQLELAGTENVWSNTGIMVVFGPVQIGLESQLNNEGAYTQKFDDGTLSAPDPDLVILGQFNNTGLFSINSGNLINEITGTFINNDTLNFGDIAAFRMLNNRGLFHNQANGVINLDAISGAVPIGEKSYWLENKSSGILRNAGKILSIGVVGDFFPDTVIVNRGKVENLLGGDIQLHHPSGHIVGIFNEGTFHNMGECAIGKTDEPLVTAIINRDSFINQSPANLHINNTTANSIRNDENGVFQNIGGDIFIGQVVAAQQFGITNKGIFQNIPDQGLIPSILMEETSDDGLVNEINATFFNDGTFRIGVNGSVGRGGIFNKGLFDNGSNGNLQIENFGAAFPQPIGGGIANETIFKNTGRVDITNSQNEYRGILNRATGSFQNEVCGQFTSDLFIDNFGTMTNSGFWESTRQFSSHGNAGTFTNAGILEDQFDSFGGLGIFPEDNEIVNNGIIIRPITIEDDQTTIEEPFTIGNNLTGNYEFGGDFGEELFDVNNQEIGEFDIFDHIVLDNPLPLGNEKVLNFPLKDLNQECVSDITLLVNIETAFNCSLTPTNATNGQNNGAITTTITGGNAPFTFTWDTPAEEEPTTQNLTNLPAGNYLLTITDHTDKTTTCEITISMFSSSPVCGNVTITWDGGVSHDGDGRIIRDEDTNEPIFFGDGVNWDDPKNWRGDQVPTPTDVVGGFFEIGLVLPDNRKQIQLNVDVTVKAFVAGNIGLTIPQGRTLTVECKFSNGLFENSGTLIVTAGTALVGNIDFVNNGLIDVTGVGSDDVILAINQVDSKTNNGIIEVDNLSRNGFLLNAGGLINNGEINLKNGSQAIAGGIFNKTMGQFNISNVQIGINTESENEGVIFMTNLERGIINNFLNKEGGLLLIDQADICIEIEEDETFTNNGIINLGRDTAQILGCIKTGIINQGIFTNEDSLIIEGFTEIGILNQANPAQVSSNKVAAIFVNEVLGHLEINGKIDASGRPLPPKGIRNENSFFQNRNDLFIKDIRKIGIQNLAHRTGDSDTPGDLFRNEGTISLNFIGINVNKAAAMGIHNFQNAEFNNENEILIGTFKGDFSNGGKIKGAGIYLESNEEFGAGRDSSRFTNHKLIKIDNVINGGKINGVLSGHGLFVHQRKGRFIRDDLAFINKGTNPFGTGLLQIGGHKKVAGSGIHLNRTAVGFSQIFQNENGATIRINQTGKHGVEAIGDGNNIAQFDNDGLLNIGDQITIEGSGIVIENSEFNNQSNGEVRVNATFGNGIEVSSNTTIRVLFDALFTNENIVKIGNAADIDQSGILVKLAETGNVDQRVEFRNLDNGVIEIDRCSRSGIELVSRILVDDGHLEFENHNRISIGQNTPTNMPIGENGMEIVNADFRMFTPANGTALLEIDNVKEHGIRLEKGDLSLRDAVKIGVNQDIGLDGIHVQNSSSRVFNNGILKIEKTGRNGIDVEDGDFSNNVTVDVDNLNGTAILMSGANADFTNHNLVKIGTVPVGGFGIQLEESADFENNSRVEILGALGGGVFNNGDFNNNVAASVLLIDNCDTAFINQRNLNNFNRDGQILIEDFKVGILNNRVTPAFASINNSGMLRIQNTPANANDLCLQNINGGFFTNNGCAIIELFGRFENKASTLRNFGFFILEQTPNFASITNEGTFQNDGVVEDVQQRLVGGSITNNDVLLHPTCAGNPQNGLIQKVIQLGDIPAFTIGINWTAPNIGAGTYTQEENETTFQNPFPDTSIIASFTVTDDIRNCVLNAQQTLDFRPTNQGIQTDAGTDQLDLCVLNTALAANQTAQNVTGLWSFSDAADGTGTIAEPSNPLSAFSGTFGQNYTLRWTQNATCGSGSDEVLITFNPDSDNDTVCDDEDICADGDDRIDNNANGIPDACDGDNAPCAENNLTLNDNPILADTYHATQTITSTGTVANNTEVIFKAGTSITLSAGFHAVAGSDFSAMIEACPAALVSREVLNHHDFKNQPIVNVFPNPVQYSTNLEIALSIPTEIQLDLYDLNGRKVANLVAPTLLSSGRHLYEWQCEAVEKGMYLLVLNGQQVGKLVVIR